MEANRTREHLQVLTYIMSTFNCQQMTDPLHLLSGLSWSEKKPAVRDTDAWRGHGSSATLNTANIWPAVSGSHGSTSRLGLQLD